MAGSIVLGAENVAGFAFLNDSDTLTTPGGVSVTITDPAGTATVYTDADAEVTLGDVLPPDLRGDLAKQTSDFTAADLAAGTGCVSVIHTPNLAGTWHYYCLGTSGVIGAQRTYTQVLPIVP